MEAKEHAGKVTVGALCQPEDGFLEHRLADHIQKLLDGENQHFVLELSNLSYLDSFGLGQLICIRASIQAAGGSLKLLRPQRHIRKLFQITKLDTVFDIVTA